MEEEFVCYGLDLVLGTTTSGHINRDRWNLNVFCVLLFGGKKKVIIKLADMVNEMFLLYKRLTHSITTENVLESAQHKLIEKKLHNHLFLLNCTTYGKRSN
jgi:hypothetical protein